MQAAGTAAQSCPAALPASLFACLAGREFGSCWEMKLCEHCCRLGSWSEPQQMEEKACLVAEELSSGDKRQR